MFSASSSAPPISRNGPASSHFRMRKKYTLNESENVSQNLRAENHQSAQHQHALVAVGELGASQLSVLVDHLQPHRRELPSVRRVERHGVDARSAVLRLEQRDPPRSK